MTSDLWFSSGRTHLSCFILPLLKVIYNELKLICMILQYYISKLPNCFMNLLNQKKMMSKLMISVSMSDSMSRHTEEKHHSQQ